MSHMNIGNYYFKLSDYSKAVEWIEKSISLFGATDANKVMALNNLAQAYRESGRLDKSLSALQTAVALLNVTRNGTYSLSNTRLWTVSNLFTVRGLACDWRDIEYSEQLILQAVRLRDNDEDGHLWRDADSGISTSVPQLDPYSFLLQRHRSLADDLAVSRLACPSSSPPTAHASVSGASRQPVNGSPPRVLRVGYLSYDWRDHPMGRLTQRLVTSHNASRVDAVNIMYGPNDNSEVSARVRSQSPLFVDLHAVVQDDEAAAALNRLDLDILIDITSHTYNGRIELVARKPAGIVMSYLGFPGSSGCEAVDYYIASARTIPPEAASGYSERLVYLPRSYQSNDMPLSAQLCRGERECRARLSLTALPVPVAVGEHPEMPSSDLKLDGRPLLCTFNAMKKLEPTAFGVWMNILRRLPTAVLVLLAADRVTLSNIRSELAVRGISPGRVLLVNSVG